MNISPSSGWSTDLGFKRSNCNLRQKNIFSRNWRMSLLSMIRLLQFTIQIQCGCRSNPEYAFSLIWKHLWYEHFLNSPTDKIFLFQGAGINVDRGAEEAIEANFRVDSAVLLFGGGDVPMTWNEMLNYWICNKSFLSSKTAYGNSLSVYITFWFRPFSIKILIWIINIHFQINSSIISGAIAHSCF